ncbi:MAG: hypothetical protein KAG61_05805, partial [Bacteriovoracaceae bacterium]|nr:hypothetical protein [Bacteriovoracaceae bacterium]
MKLFKLSISILAFALILSNAMAANKKVVISATKSPFMKYSPVESISFQGEVKIPNHITINKGYVYSDRDRAVINLGRDVNCEYRGKHYRVKKMYLYKCSEGSRQGDWVDVDGNIDIFIKRSYAYFSSLKITATLDGKYEEQDPDDPILTVGPQGEVGPQ